MLPGRVELPSIPINEYHEKKKRLPCEVWGGEKKRQARAKCPKFNEPIALLFYLIRH